MNVWSWWQSSLLELKHLSETLTGIQGLHCSGQFFSINFIKNISFVYQKALIRTFHTSFWLQNNLCVEFLTQEHKIRWRFCTKKQVSKVCLKDFRYTNINLIKTNSINTHSTNAQNYFLTLNNYWIHSPNQIWVKNIYFFIQRDKANFCKNRKFEYMNLFFSRMVKSNV